MTDRIPSDELKSVNFSGITANSVVMIRNIVLLSPLAGQWPGSGRPGTEGNRDQELDGSGEDS
jgi:hypothetical protein